MRINEHDYAKLKGLVQNFLADQPGMGSRLVEVARASIADGYTYQWFLWDFWHVVGRHVDTWPWQKSVYEYANDQHITTALKRVVEELAPEAHAVWKS